MTRRLLLLTPTLLACNREVERRDSGVAVGNPGEMRARVAQGGDGALDEAWLGVGILAVVDCETDEDVAVAADVALDLTGDALLLLPSGTWCGLWMADGWIAVDAVVGDDQPLTVSLPLDELWVEAPSGFAVAGEGFALRLGPEGWLDADALGIAPEDGAVTLDDPTDGRAEELHDALAYASALGTDDDDDGAIDGDDSVVAAGEDAPEAEELWDAAEEDEDEEEPDASGCGGGAAAAPFALFALLGWRRRRR